MGWAGATARIRTSYYTDEYSMLKTFYLQTFRKNEFDFPVNSFFLLRIGNL